MTKSFLVPVTIAALMATTAFISTGASAQPFGGRTLGVQTAMVSMDDLPSTNSGRVKQSMFTDLPIDEIQKIRRPGDHTSGVSVLGDPQLVFGQPGGHKGKGTSLGSLDNSEGGANSLNLPGSQNVGKKGSKSAAAFLNNSGGASSLNLPGTQGSKGKASDKAAQLSAAMEAKAQAMLSEAANNGVNNLNIPTGSSSSDMSSREITPEQVGQGGMQKGTGPVQVNQEMYDFLTRTADQRPIKSSAGAESAGAAAGSKIDNSSNGLVNTGLTGADHAESKAAQAGSAPKSTDGGKGSPTSGKKTNGSDNNPDSDTTPVDASSGLSTDSAIAHTTDGGGTDNNSTETAGTTGTLAPGSSYARRDWGDGANDDTGTPVLLADDTAIAHSGDGDGGSGDGRGDNGHTKIGSWVKPTPVTGGQ